MIQSVEQIKLTRFYDIFFPILQRVLLKKWLKQGKTTPPPHLIKQQIVKEYAQNYQIPIFIETGTYLGMMVNAVKNNFQEIYSIELDKKLFQYAKNKFKRFAHIKILQGDSEQILPKILKEVNKPALFWLDAHYSKGITSLAKKQTPIIAELKAIFKHQIKNHVVLIDDADAFVGKDDYPTITFIKNFISKNYPKFMVQVKYNVIRITPRKNLSPKAKK